MAATGFTPVSLYYSATASNVPLAANLVAGELAMNTNDGKLFYKDSSGVVQTMASKGTGSIGGSTTQVQFNNAGVLGGSASLTWSGTVLTSSGFAGPLNGTVGATTPAAGSFTTTTIGTSETLSYGTANGVAYLNGSKVLTSGSALTFDSSDRLIVGAASAVVGNRVEVVGNSSGQGIGIRGRASDALGIISWHANAAATEYARISSDNTSSLYFGVGASGTEQMRLTSTGLGIGTSSPNRLLSLYATQPVFQITNVASGNTQGTIQYQASGSTDFILDNQGSGSGGVIAFMQAGAERMRIDSSGNVGIGTTSPTQKLSIGFADASSGFLEFRSSTYAKLAQIEGADDSSSGNGHLAFYTRSGGTAGERMRIDSSGNLLVGTTSGSGARIRAQGASTTGSDYAFIAQDSAGNVLLLLRNDGYIQTSTTGSGPYANTTASAANMFVSSGGVLQRSTSSLKYKKNVQDATHGLANLLQLRSVTYEGKAETDAGKTFGGLIAEEVHAAGLTEFVQYAKDGSPDALNYGNMVSLCIKAIQEQQALIQDLTTRLVALEAK